MSKPDVSRPPSRSSLVSIESLRRFSAASLNSLKNVFLRQSSTVSSASNASNLSKEEGIELVDTVRREVLELVVEEQDKVDARDVQRIKSNAGRLIDRFVEYKRKESPSADKDQIITLSVTYLMSWLAWRHDYGVNDLNVRSYPSEIFDNGILSFFLSTNQDKDTVVYVCIRKYRKVTKDVTDILVKLFVLCSELICERSRPGQMVKIVFDASGLGYANADISLVIGIVPIWFNYYPGLIRSFDVIDSNFVVKAALTVIIKVFPAHMREKIKFTDRKSLLEEVGPEAVPAYLGGSGGDILGTEVFREEPCLSFEQFGKDSKLPADVVRKFKKMLLESRD